MKCPKCGCSATCDTVDIGVGEQQCGPYGCERCHWVEGDPFNGDDSTWIQTFTGLQFWPLDPRSDQVVLEDIAHALALKCRYTGHCLKFYSIAQHSYLVAELVGKLGNRQLALTALLHDAAEAYTADIARPVKKAISQFAEIEHRLERVIAERFNLIYPFPECVKSADNVLLETERRDIMSPPPRPWKHYAEPMEKKVLCWPWEVAEVAFLDRARELL